jgi:hypothetical protein
VGGVLAGGLMRLGYVAVPSRKGRTADFADFADGMDCLQSHSLKTWASTSTLLLVSVRKHFCLISEIRVIRGLARLRCRREFLQLTGSTASGAKRSCVPAGGELCQLEETSWGRTQVLDSVRRHGAVAAINPQLCAAGADNTGVRFVGRETRDADVGARRERLTARAGKGAKAAKAAKVFVLAPLVHRPRKGDKGDKGDNWSRCPPSISLRMFVWLQPRRKADAASDIENVSAQG